MRRRGSHRGGSVPASSTVSVPFSPSLSGSVSINDAPVVAVGGGWLADAVTSAPHASDTWTDPSFHTITKNYFATN